MPHVVGSQYIIVPAQVRERAATGDFYENTIDGKNQVHKYVLYMPHIVAKDNCTLMKLYFCTFRMSRYVSLMKIEEEEGANESRDMTAL
jgi:hypothetical protein